MKRFAICAALAVAVGSPVGASDAVKGIWKTQPGDDGAYGHVRIYDCEGTICGVIQRAFDASGAEVESENIGKRMIWDMVDEGGGAFGDGSIWAPDRDRIYRSKMTLAGDELTVEGCVAGGLICRGQIWTRVQ